MLEKDNLTEKIYYTIGEVAKMFNVTPSLIRYWESEFPHIAPRKNSKGERRYTKADIQKIQEVYYLIKEKRFTIEGAKAYLSEQPDKKKKEIKEKLEYIKNCLIQISNQL